MKTLRAIIPSRKHQSYMLLKNRDTKMHKDPLRFLDCTTIYIMPLLSSLTVTAAHNSTWLLTLLCLVNVEISILQQFADDRLDIFADVTCLRQRRAVTYGKRDVKTTSQDLGKESLP